MIESTKAYVICHEDTVVFVVIGDKERATKKMEELVEEDFQNNPFIDPSRKPCSYKEIRWRHVYSIEVVDVEIHR